MDDVAQHLKGRGYDAEAIHGDITQAMRMKTLEDFKKIIVAQIPTAFDKKATKKKATEKKSAPAKKTTATKSKAAATKKSSPTKAKK